MFVSGPVSGVDGLNAEAFEGAREVLEGMGCTVLVPHDFVAAHADWQTAMRRTVETLTRADVVACLDGWESSRGARIEVGIANDLGIPAIAMGEWPDLATLHQVLAGAKRTRVCRSCGRTLPLTLFADSLGVGEGRQLGECCRECAQERRRGQAAERRAAAKGGA